MGKKASSNLMTVRYGPAVDERFFSFENDSDSSCPNNLLMDSVGRTKVKKSASGNCSVIQLHILVEFGFERNG